jgi:plastocyanin
MNRRLMLLLFTVLALALAVSACGGDDDDAAAEEPAAEDTTTREETGEGGGAHLTLTADPDGAFSFDQTELTAAAGEITIELVNDSGLPHNVEIEGQDAVSETITEGSTEVTVTLEPGEYVYFCNIPGHRQGGMEGTLTVE